VLQIRPNFYMIADAGGNIGVQVGPDGAFVVNSGRQDATGEVLAAIQRLTREPIRYIVNTSADPEFVGGNAGLAKAGRSVTTPAMRPRTGQRAALAALVAIDTEAAAIIAHENVVTRMMGRRDEAAPFPVSAWPSEPFSQRRKYLYFNDEGIEILHQPAAHSDGDSFVFFRRSDVVVAGDVVDATRFPVIDIEKGGSIQGEIAALNRLIELAIPPGPYIGTPAGASPTSPQPGGTEILTGHGRVYRQIDVVNYRDMVVLIRDTIKDMIDRTLTLEQIQAAAPAKAYAPQYGAASGPWTTNDFVEAVYQSLMNPPNNALQER
jgi:glyoxylase-like metal-dependent hydrolase (beta-lactamase superfamily II)